MILNVFFKNHFSENVNGKRDPPPLHGKIHPKFPLWLLDHLPWVRFAFDNIYSGHHNHPHDHHTLRRKRRRVVGRSSRITRPPRGGSAVRCSFLESETPRAINHTCSQGSRKHRNPETTQLYHFPVKGRAGGKRNYQNAQMSFLLRCFWVVD